MISRTNRKHPKNYRPAHINTLILIIFCFWLVGDVKIDFAFTKFKENPFLHFSLLPHFIQYISTETIIFFQDFSLKSRLHEILYVIVCVLWMFHIVESEEYPS